MLIEKHWRGLIGRNIVDYFLVELGKVSSLEEVNPVISTPRFFVVNVRHESLWFLAAVQNETSPLMIIEWLYRVVEIFKEYFGEVSDVQLKENFVTVYELLEEMMDDGMPTTTEPNILKEMIQPPSFAGKIMNSVTGKSGVSDVISSASQGNVRWRKPNVKYK